MSKGAERSGLRLIAISSLLMGLTACGGGGGSSGGSTGSTLPTAPVTITSTNQSAVAGAAVDSLSGGNSTPVAAQTSASAPAADSVAQKVGKASQGLAQQMVTQGGTPALPTGAVTSYSCLVSGTWTMNVTSSSSGTATYYNCSDIANETINGTISISNLVSSATAVSFDSTYNITFTTPTDVMTITGDMHVAASGCSTTCASTTMSGRSLKYASTVNGTFALQNYTIAYDANGALTVYTYTFSSTQINGTATFTMVTPFAQRAGSLFPYSGVATVSGANSTVLKITVLGDETAAPTSQVQLELSTDGGATYGAPTFVTWASISNRL